MSTITVTKIFTFDAAHDLPGYDGKCRQLHGHTYTLEVEVSGPPLEKDPTLNLTVPTLSVPTYESMVADFGDIKKVVQQKIIDRLDHHYLNSVEGLPQPSTAEHMVEWIAEQLKVDFTARLVRVRLWETPTSYAEWRLR